MPESFQERRRSPRATVAGGHALQMPLSTTVQLVDISLGGVLMHSPHPFEEGQYARLSTRLGAVPVDVDIEVRRTSRERDDSGAFRIGARFVGLDEATRQAMSTFLTSAKR